MKDIPGPDNRCIAFDIVETAASHDAFQVGITDDVKLVSECGGNRGQA